MLVLAALMAVGMGFVLGALGGGGGILTLPALIYVLDVEPRSAMAASMVIVGVVATASMARHAFNKNVDWRVGLAFGGGAMLGSYLGARLAGFAPTSVLLLIFAVLMVVAGARLVTSKKRSKDEPDKETASWRSSTWLVAIEGLAVGAITGLVGAGGGFIVVPALVFIAGMPMRRAIGTALLVVALKAMPGAVGHLSHATIPWTLTGLFTLFALVGALGGTSVSQKLPQVALKRGFGGLLLVLAAVIAYKELAA